ncbi:MAG: Uma2 family endonuclease, partial [Chloroflexia bacterium]
MAVPLIRKRFTVHDFHRMAEAGIFGEDDRYELIDGEIVEMAAIGSKHSSCITTCTQICYELLGRSVTIIVQGPIQIGPDYEPQPDLIIARPRTDNYREDNPTPEDILLLIEVADSSFTYDQTVKVPIYAAAGIQEFWLV